MSEEELEDENNVPDIDMRSGFKTNKKPVKKPRGGFKALVSPEEEEKVPDSARSDKKSSKKLSLVPPEKLLVSAQRKADTYTDGKKSDEAIRELIRCTALTKIIYGAADWHLAESYTNLATGYLELKGYAAQGQHYAEIARDILLKGNFHAQSDEEKVEIYLISMNVYFILGKSLSLLRKWAQAENALQKSEQLLNVLKKLAPEEDIGDMEIKTAIYLGKIKGLSKQHALAIDYLEKAIRLIKEREGDDALELIPVYQDLGKIELLQGKHANQEQATKMFMEADSICLAFYSNNTVEAADTKFEVGKAFAFFTDDEFAQQKAETCFNECLTIYQTQQVPQQDKALAVQDELIKVLIRNDRGEEAMKLLLSSLELKKAQYGGVSKEVDESHKLMASLQIRSKRLDKAVASLQKALEIETLLYGGTHAKTKETESLIETLMKTPSLSAKNRSNKSGIDSRPQFANYTSTKQPLGGFRSVNS